MVGGNKEFEKVVLTNWGSIVGSYLKNQNSSNAKKYGYTTWGEVFRDLKDTFETKMLEKNGKRSIMVVKIKQFV